MASVRARVARLAAGTLVVVFAVTVVERLSPSVAKAEERASSSVFATGLQNPRGLRFGPDGSLYVAEGGTGGSMSTTAADCAQVVAPVGPYTGGFTARISRIDRAGHRTTLVGGLPSSQTSPNLGSLVSGVADVEFLDDTLYALLAGAGCSHGLKGTANGIIRVRDDGSWRLVGDLSAWSLTHRVANPEPDDFEPDGTWYSMIAVRDSLYAVEPNHGEVVRVTTDGKISRVVDVSASEGHIVPTSIAYHGNFFIGNLTTFPLVQGAAKILKLTPSGNLLPWEDNLTNIVGVEFDRRGRMYVLENTVGQPMPTPGSGRIIRIDPAGERTVIMEAGTPDSLNLPTAMTMGPDGNLYVSEWGFGPPLGQIRRVVLSHEDE